MPRISVGMPVYNVEQFLGESISSILDQTYEDFELILSDNASTDATEEICREYAAKDSRIRYFRNGTNQGPVANFNRTFELARGEYFKWNTGDDVCAPTFLRQCLDVLDREPKVVLAFPRSCLIDAEGRVTARCPDRLHLQSRRPHDRLLKFVMSYTLCNSFCGLIRSEALRRTNLLAPYSGSDYILLIDLCLRGTFWEVPEYLFYRREHARNVHRLPPHERARWFGSQGHWTDLYPSVKLFLMQLATIRRAALGVDEKALCSAQVVLWAFRKWLLKCGDVKARLGGRRCAV